MPPIAHIYSRNHNILLNMETGEYTVERSKYRRMQYCEWDENVYPVEFEKMLSESFRLSSDVFGITEFIYEVAGNSLVNFSDYDCSMYGDELAALKIITVIEGVCLKKIFQKTIKSFIPHEDLTKTTTQMVIPVGSIDSSMLTHNFKKEEPGILRKCVDGASRLIRRGRFYVPYQCEKAYRECMRNIDPVGNFIENRVVFADGAKVEVERLYKSFLNYTGGLNHITRTDLINQLRNSGIMLQHGSHGRLRECIGIALKAP